MKSIWNGAIVFGLISIPVRLCVAVEEKSMRFRQLHGADNGRIRYRRVCSACEQEVAYEEIVRAYEYEKDCYVVFTEEELEHLPAEPIKAIEIVNFVPLSEIDPLYFQRSYYVIPEPVGLKPYRLLERALSRSGQVAIAKVILREKEHLATLRIQRGVLVLETMYWPDEIGQPELGFLEKPVDIHKEELGMAESLIELLSDHFRPTRFVDIYRERLQEAARAKIEGQEVVVAPAGRPVQFTDLMEALRASVEAARAKRGMGSESKSP